jgi:cytidylate kinase
MRQPEGVEKDGRLITVIVDGEDVSWKIRTEEMSRGSSAVAKLPALRKELVRKQQQIAKRQSVVMEGRDITFRVLPEAELKVYMTATIEERAKRRQQQLLMQGQDVSYDQVLDEMKKRDKQDMEREVDPLHVVEDAWVLDTTGMTIEGVVKSIVEKVNELIG